MEKPVSKTSNYIKGVMPTNNSLIIVIDVQDKLMNNIFNRDVVIKNIQKIIEAASILKIKTSYTEQNPCRLGNSLNEIDKIIDDDPIMKMDFSCHNTNEVKKIISGHNVKNILLCGIESHVCILQSALGFISSGYAVYVPIDAIGSRHKIDHKYAINRLVSNDVVATTTEAIIFEWCGTADRDEFRLISSLIKRTI